VAFAERSFRFEQLGIVIGASAISLGLTLAAFMGGMCLGSLGLSRFWSLRPPLRVYAWLEAGSGVLGAATLALILVAGRLYPAASGAFDLALRAAAAAV